MNAISDPTAVYRRVLQRKHRLEDAELWPFYFSTLNPTKVENSDPPDTIYVDELDMLRKPVSISVPFKHNRVNVDIRGDGFKGYVNASYVRFKSLGRQYIMSAIPAPSEEENFWRMILEQKVPAIVMFQVDTDAESEYFPKQFGGTEKFGLVKVECYRMYTTSSYYVRRLMVKMSGESHEVVHYHFFTKLDHQAGNAVNEFFYLYREITNPQHNFLRPPPASRGLLVKLFGRSGVTSSDCTRAIVIQCRTGSGASGTFVLFDILNKMLRERVPHTYFIEDSIMKLRLQRMNAVDTVKQYRFLYETFLERTWRLHDIKDLRDSTPFVGEYNHVLPILTRSEADQKEFLKPDPTWLAAMEVHRDAYVDGQIRKKDQMRTESRFRWKSDALSKSMTVYPRLPRAPQIARLDKKSILKN